MRYAWQVISRSGDVQSGVVDSWAEAIEALADWYGDGTEPDDGYYIQPIKPGTPQWNAGKRPS